MVSASRNSARVVSGRSTKFSHVDDGSPASWIIKILCRWSCRRRDRSVSPGVGSRCVGLQAAPLACGLSVSRPFSIVSIVHCPLLIAQVLQASRVRECEPRSTPFCIHRGETGFSPALVWWCGGNQRFYDGELERADGAAVGGEVPTSKGLSTLLPVCT